jgi:hypothetical protein
MLFVVEIVLDQRGEAAHTERHMDDDQFTKLSKQIADMGEQFGEQFAKLYQHTERQFGEVHTRMDQLESRMSSLEGGVDSVLKNQETDQQERLIANHQLDRHEGWIKQLAQKTDTSLSYE